MKICSDWLAELVLGTAVSVSLLSSTGPNMQLFRFKIKVGGN